MTQTYNKQTISEYTKISVTSLFAINTKNTCKISISTKNNWQSKTQQKAITDQVDQSANENKRNVLSRFPSLQGKKCTGPNSTEPQHEVTITRRVNLVSSVIHISRQRRHHIVKQKCCHQRQQESQGQRWADCTRGTYQRTALVTELTAFHPLNVSVQMEMTSSLAVWDSLTRIHLTSRSSLRRSQRWGYFDVYRRPRSPAPAPLFLAAGD